MLGLVTLKDTVSPRAEIEDHEGNEINKKTEKKFKNKTKEQNKHEENRQDDIKNIIDESLEKAYRIEIGQKDNSGRNCNKCGVSLRNKKNSGSI